MKYLCGCLLVGLLLFHSMPRAEEATDKKSGGNLEEKLSQRVTLFYTALKKNRWEVASQFVIKHGREEFEAQDRGKIHDFNIQEIYIERDKKSARVIVGCTVNASFAGRMVIPRELRWKLVSGEWYYDPTDAPKPLFVRYSESQKAIKAKGGSDVKFENLLIDFGKAAQGKTLNLSFPFVNQSKKEVWIEQVSLPKVTNLPDYMTDKTTAKSFKPGEKGEIALEMNTGKLLQEVESTVFVEFQPVNEIYSLKVKGRVLEEKYMGEAQPK